jgi:hypothetical protein
MSLKTLYLDEYWWCGDRLKNGRDFFDFLFWFLTRCTRTTSGGWQWLGGCKFWVAMDRGEQGGSNEPKNSVFG